MVQMCCRPIYAVPKQHIYAAKKNFFYLSIKKNKKKVEFRIDPYEAILERCLKSDEKMAFGTNGLTIKKMETIAFLKYFSVANLC